MEPQELDVFRSVPSPCDSCGAGHHIVYQIALLNHSVKQLQDKIDAQQDKIEMLLDSRSKALGIWIGISTLSASVGVLLTLALHAGMIKA